LPAGSLRSATEQLHAVLEQAAQGEPPAMDPRLDGPERDTGHVRDLGIVEAFDVVQDDRDALIVGDLTERTGQHPRSLGAHRRAFGVGILAGWRLPALVVEFG